MQLADQPSNRPTNKLAAGVTTYAAWDILAQDAVREVWVQLPYAFLTGPALTNLVVYAVPIVAAFAIGWFVPDENNIPR